MLAGVEMGLAFPDRADGVAPQVSRLCWPWPPVEPVLEPVFEPVLDPVFEPVFDPVEPVVEPDEDEDPDDEEPVAAPVGFEDVGTTAGTEEQALS